MKRLIVAMLFATATAYCQTSSTGSITINGATCAVTNACVSLHFPPAAGMPAGTGAIVLSGTWSATIQFEASADNGATWVGIQGSPQPSGAAVTSATGNGTWLFQVSGTTDLRARASAFVSGSVGVFINTTPTASGGGGGPATALTTADAATFAGADAAAQVNNCLQSTYMSCSDYRLNGAYAGLVGPIAIPAGKTLYHGTGTFNIPICPAITLDAGSIVYGLSQTVGTVRCGATTGGNVVQSVGLGLDTIGRAQPEIHNMNLVDDSGLTNFSIVDVTGMSRLVLDNNILTGSGTEVGCNLPQSISAWTRDGSNNVTVTTATAHQAKVGGTITIAGATGGATNPNGNFVVTGTPSTTQVVFTQTGAAESGAATGSVTLAVDSIYQVWTHNYLTSGGAGSTLANFGNRCNAITMRANRLSASSNNMNMIMIGNPSQTAPNQVLIDANSLETSSSPSGVVAFNLVNPGPNVVITNTNRCEIPGTNTCIKYPATNNGEVLVDALYTSPSATTMLSDVANLGIGLTIRGGGGSGPVLLSGMGHGIENAHSPNMIQNANLEYWTDATHAAAFGTVAFSTGDLASGTSKLAKHATSGAPADSNSNETNNAQIGDGTTSTGQGIAVLNPIPVPVGSAVVTGLMRTVTFAIRWASPNTNTGIRLFVRCYTDAGTSASTGGNILTTTATNGRMFSTGEGSSGVPFGLTYDATLTAHKIGADITAAQANTWQWTVFNARIPATTRAVRPGFYVATSPTANTVYLKEFRFAFAPVVTDDSGFRPLQDSGLGQILYGSATLATGTVTVTFPHAFNQTPVCTASPTTSGTFTAGSKLTVNPSTTTVVIASSTGTDTAVVNWTCAQPND